MKFEKFACKKIPTKQPSQQPFANLYEGKYELVHDSDGMLPYWDLTVELGDVEYDEYAINNVVQWVQVVEMSTQAVTMAEDSNKMFWWCLSHGS